MEDNNTVNTPMKHEDTSVTLTIRLIMQGKEVGSIIGKKGEIVNRFREESGAKINISDGSCPERIVTVSGTTSAIFSAFTLITKKFEEFTDVGKVGKTHIPIRLIVPASQCGSLIGKSGSKIKEIRQTTGCSIQVASEMLPNSTERAVTLSGTAEQITQCIYQICLVMLESPPRGATIPYRPKPQVSGPLILANGQAYTIQGNYAVPTQETCPVFPLALATGGLHAGISGLTDPLLKGAHLPGAVPAHHHLQHIPDQVTKTPLASLAALGLAGMTQASTGGLNHSALAALAGSQLRTANTNRAQQQQHEMTVSNDLIGCIIGKGGTKIAEIRQISGAMIRISNCEERESGNTDRTITISGNPDSVAVAQYLINMSVELQKANLQEANNGVNGPPGAAVGQNGNSSVNPQNSNSTMNTNTTTTTTNNTITSNQNNNTNSTTTSTNTTTTSSNNCNSSNSILNSNSNPNNTIQQQSNNPNNINTSNQTKQQPSSASALTCTTTSAAAAAALATLTQTPSNSNSLPNNNNTMNPNLNANAAAAAAVVAAAAANAAANNQTNHTNNHHHQHHQTNGQSHQPPLPPAPPSAAALAVNPLAAAAASSFASAIPLAQLLSKPNALNALSALGGLSDFLGGLATLGGPPVQTTGVHRSKSFATSRFRSHSNADGSGDGEKVRNKFNPY